MEQWSQTDFLAVSLELLYHVAAIIACRSGIVASKSYVRREAAANQIESILSSNTSIHKSPLPIASYAASLSMTVAYRKLRDNQLTGNLLGYVECLGYRCEILESFKERWWSAEAMARLGRRALQNVQEVSNGQNRGQKKANAQDRTSHIVEAVNPLEMLSSVAESHAHGGLSNDLSQTLTTAAEPGDLLATDQQTIEIERLAGEGAVADGIDEESDPFRDLDTAFGDFFDLSMPTTFFDPLFEEMGAMDFSQLPE
jgi:hypothetical protein